MCGWACRACTGSRHARWSAMITHNSYGGRSMRVLISLLVAVLLLAGAAVALWRGLDWEMDQPASSSAPVRIEVPAGAALRTVLQQLQRQGAVRNARLVTLYLRLHGSVVRVQAGTYEVAAHASARAILDQLNSGRVLLEALT